MLYNPTKGITLLNGNAGRLTIDRLFGQPMQVGLDIDTAYDVVSVNGLHFWPFWQDNAFVEAYMESNLDAIYLRRCDNPLFSNIFTIFARAGLRIGQNANGTTSKMHMVNADFDRGAYGVWVDGTVTNGCTGQFDNITHQGETGLAGSKALYVQGTNSSFDFGSFRTDLCNQNGVRLEGTGHTVKFGNLTINNYDQSATNFPAIEALNNNIIRLSQLPTIGAGGGAGGKYAATGTISVDDWRAFTPVVNPATGTITTLGAVSGKYKVLNNTVYVEASITITTNGTAAGDLRFNLPFGTSTADFIGVGRDVVVSGKTLSVTIASAGTQALINTFDNIYPGSNGCKLVVAFSYSI